MCSEHSILLPDGRRIVWEDAGRPDGVPILFCHRVPGSRLQRWVFIEDEVLEQTGTRMISPDRPGVGRSDFQPGRRIEDWPRDVGALIEHLHLESFSVLAFSGGTPYAVAVTASKTPLSVRNGVDSTVQKCSDLGLC